jgi:hypothetical protein
MNEHGIAEYYAKKGREARELRKRLETETDPQEIARLKSRLELAEYVGD